MGFEKGIVSLLFPGSSQIVDSMSRCKREEITTCGEAVKGSVYSLEVTQGRKETDAGRQWMQDVCIF